MSKVIKRVSEAYLRPVIHQLTNRYLQFPTKFTFLTF